MKSPQRLALVLGLLGLLATACHKKQVPVGLPAQPAQQPEAQKPASSGPSQTAPEKPAQSETETAPSTAPATPPMPASTTPAKDETIYQRNKPPDQPPAVKKPAHPAAQTPPAPPQGPTQPAATPPPAESPQLGDVLTPEQQKQYNSAIDQSLARAQANLGTLQNRQLSQEQQATEAQVRNFIQQAQTTRNTDLAAAKSLAERADVLASDLVASLK